MTWPYSEQVVCHTAGREVGRGKYSKGEEKEKEEEEKGKGKKKSARESRSPCVEDRSSEGVASEDRSSEATPSSEGHR